MQRNDSPSEFAFAENEHNGRVCPVLASGRDVTGRALEVAEHYDSLATERVDDVEMSYGSGTIPRDVAKEIWDDLIEECNDLARRTDCINEEQYYRERAEVAEAVRRDVF